MEIPKKEDEFLKELFKAAESGDEEAQRFLFRNRDHHAVRSVYSKGLGKLVNENYDNPLNVFQNKEILKEVPIEYGNLPENIAGRFSQTKNKITLNPNNSDLLHKQTGVKIHELGHANDALSGFESQPIITPDRKLIGLDAAEQAFSDHHQAGFFEKDALAKLLKNKKLSMLPALATGAALLGASERANAGDYSGAALEGAGLVDPTGLAQAAKRIKDRLAMSPEESKQAKKEDYRQALPIGLDIEQQAIDQAEEPDRFQKLKQKLSDK